MTDERGDTLVEILVALGLLGLLVAAIAGALIGSASASTAEKEMVSLNASVRSFAESMRAEITSARPGDPSAFDDCATADGGSHPYPVISVLNPASGPPGSTVTAFATGFPPTSPIEVTAGYGPQTFQSDAHGDATMSFQVASSTVLFTDGGISLSRDFSLTGGPAAPEDTTGFRIEVTGLQWWDEGDQSFVASSSASCPLSDRNGLQLVTVQGWAPGAQTTLTFALSNSNGLAPTLLAPSTVSFNAGTAGSFDISAAGYPTPAFSFKDFSGCQSNVDGTGITATDNGDGTATVSSTDATPAGSYQLCVTASNGVLPAASEIVTILVGGLPAITYTPDPATFEHGTDGTLTLSTSGYPTPISLSDTAFPGCTPDADLTFGSTTSGTVTVTVPASTPPGRYTLCAVATNAYGSTDEAIPVVVHQAPVIEPAGPWDLLQGSSPSSFSISTTGYPVATQFTAGSFNLGPGSSCTETFPLAEVTVTSNGDGTADVTLTSRQQRNGRSRLLPAGSYTLCMQASNGTDPPTGTTITVVVGTKPYIGLSSPIDLSEGQFDYTTMSHSGSPAPTLAVTSGSLPQGMALDSANFAIYGTPTGNDLGDHNVVITATNPFGTSSVSVDFYVNAPPPPP